MDTKLPNNWVKTTLGEIAVWSSGGTPRRGMSEYYGGDIPWIKTGDLNNGIVTEVSEFLTKKGIENSSAKIFPKDSVGIAMYGATIGKTGVFGMDAATNQACTVAIPFLGMNRYLHLFLKSQKQAFIDKGKGGAQPNISQTVIKAHEIYLPPLPEQERIVEKLNLIFTELNDVKIRLEKIPILLKNYRKGLLSQAVTGKLTEEWRRGKKFKWNKTKVGDFMLEVKDRGNPLDLPETVYLGLEHFQKDGGIIGNSSSKDVKSIKTLFKKGDVLYGKLRPYLNKHDVVEFDGVCSTDILVYRNKDERKSIFFDMFLGTSNFIQKSNKESKGINLPRVSSKIINEFNISVPSDIELDEIVKRVEFLFSKTELIEKQYKTLKEKIDKLPQSILHKAFKGELVEQLSTDGDARELLIEIKKLKTEMNKNEKRRKK